MTNQTEHSILMSNGSKGSIYISSTDTSSYTGGFGEFEAYTATVLGVVVGSGISNSSNMNGDTIAATNRLKGHMSVFALTSGSGILLKDGIST